MANPQDFFIEHNNKFLDEDSIDGAQCVDVIKAFFSECLGIPPVKGNAIDYWTTPPQGFTKETEPKPWDIVVFDYKPVGHIAVINWSSATEINCFSQNDPLGAPCGFKTYPRDSHILGYLRWPNFPAPSPRPEQTPNTGAFTLQYTIINTSPTLLEQARQLLVQYSDGKLDCNFHYWQLPPIISPSLFPSEEAQLFLKEYPVLTPFCFLTYSSVADPGYVNMVTKEVSGVILTALKGVPTPFNVCYEFVHAMTDYLLLKGYPVGIPADINTPDEAFLKAKIATISPFVDKLLANS